VWRTNSAEIVTLDRGSETTRIAWARRGMTTTITLPAVNSEATLVSTDGTTTTLTATRGHYDLTLPAALCNDPKYGCTIGGTPVIVVESQPARPAKVLRAAPVRAPAQPAPESAADVVPYVVIGIAIEVVVIAGVLVGRQRSRK